MALRLLFGAGVCRRLLGAVCSIGRHRRRRRRCQVTLARPLAGGWLVVCSAPASALCPGSVWPAVSLSRGWVASVLGHALLRPRACIHCLPGRRYTDGDRYTRNSRCIIELCGLVSVLHLVLCMSTIVGLSALSRFTAQSMKSRYLDGPTMI